MEHRLLLQVRPEAIVQSEPSVLIPPLIAGSYLTDAINMFPGKKVWLTEFAGSGTAAERATFFKTVVPWLYVRDCLLVGP